MRIPKIIRRLTIILLILLTCFFLLFKPVDTTPFTETTYYSVTHDRIYSIAREFQRQPVGVLGAGWSVKPILPPEPVRLTGNHPDPYDSINDPVYVRTLLLTNSGQRIAIISYDLWIMHPTLVNSVKEAVSGANLDIDGYYFTATHTHSSIGGWADGLIGQAVVGGNNEATLSYITSQTVAALTEATKQIQLVSVEYTEAETEGLVKNRLSNDGLIDQKIRALKFHGQNGDAFFVTFSAHAVYRDADDNAVSADYPGFLVNAIEKSSSASFAAFAAGAVGSHTVERDEDRSTEKITAYANALAGFLLQSEKNTQPTPDNTLKFTSLPVALPEPQFRITDTWRVRPWLFNSLLGNHPASITCLQVGRTLLVGLPVELSGEFYPELETLAREHGFSLMITCFNGTYLGYAPPGSYYFTRSHAETREMNWYGPHTGEYFATLIREVILAL